MGRAEPSLFILEAEEPLSAGDVGLIPWLPQVHFDGPPEPIFRQCRERIDRDALPSEHENLIAAYQDHVLECGCHLEVRQANGSN